MKEQSYIDRLNSKSIPELRKLAQKVFNAWIRDRDNGKPCISCTNPNPNQAGHYYSAGHYPGVALNEDNCHLQCIKCNMYLHGNLLQYEKGLWARIGEKRKIALDLKVDILRHSGYKHDRFTLIETILKYKSK